MFSVNMRPKRLVVVVGLRAPIESTMDVESRITSVDLADVAKNLSEALTDEKLAQIAHEHAGLGRL